MQMLNRLFDHDLWATNQLLTAAERASEGDLDREFDIGHRTLRATFEHMIMNIEGWSAAFNGQEPETKGSTVADLTQRFNRALPAFAAVALSIESSGRLDETFEDAFGEAQTFGAAFLMLILHDEGHRTEALHMLRRLGLADDLEVDYGLWDFVRRGLVT